MSAVYALVDCDSFFVSCEQVLNPKIKNFPVCVLSNNMGCVIARSKEAKSMGIEMCMPYVIAKKRFPGAIYLKGEHHKYQEFSLRVMDVLRDYSPNVEVYSIDEAFLDLGGTKKMHKKNYYKIVKDIKERIKTEVGIDVSIGLSITKTLAKVASDKAKGRGIYIIGKSKIKKEMNKLRVEDIWGIGSRTKKALHSFGIKMADEFLSQDEKWIKQRFGKHGVDLRHELTGIVVSPVDCSARKPKSIQITRSFMEASSDKEFIKKQLKRHVQSACRKVRREGGKAKSVVVMLRRKDFIITSERVVFEHPLDFELDIIPFALDTFDKIWQDGVLYRSCGVTLDVLTFENELQLNFLSAPKLQKSEKLAKAVDKIEKLHGKNTVKVGF